MQHFCPALSEIIERFKFHRRSRQPGESVCTFIAELRLLSEFCNFGDTLDVMIRDRLVCEINDVTIQKRLLAEPGLTYKKAVKIAQAAETAAQSLKELRGKPDSSTSLSHSSQQESVHNTSEQQAKQQAQKLTLTCYAADAQDIPSLTQRCGMSSVQEERAYETSVQEQVQMEFGQEKAHQERRGR